MIILFFVPFIVLKSFFLNDFYSEGSRRAVEPGSLPDTSCPMSGATFLLLQKLNFPYFFFSLYGSFSVVLLLK
jgi:hypothetical protein